MLGRLVNAVASGELSADTPAERRNVRRLEGLLADTEMTGSTAHNFGEIAGQSCACYLQSHSAHRPPLIRDAL